MLPCRQIAHRIRKAAVVAGRNVTKLRNEVKTLSEARRVGSVLIRVRSAWPMVVIGLSPLHSAPLRTGIGTASALRAYMMTFAGEP